MKTRRIIKLSLVVASMSFAGASFAGGASGAMLGNTCAGCHGTNGNSLGPATPSIAGISKDYFVDTMQAYKKGERPATIMTRIAKGYSDGDIKQMATFFAGIKFKSGAQKADLAAAKRGKKIHKKYCEKCHENGGTSSEDDAGILAGQWKPYLQYTMADFQAGREMPKKMKKKMKALHKKKGDKGLNDLFEFYASRK
ncbi:MAG: cytochrome c4 [Gammaproteobacteria bacterium]|nr:MAG: cytochrome c4 [Gammaproteobacteria bacterium]